MSDVLKRIEEAGIIPVVVIDDIKDALPLMNALVEGGIPAAEVTFRTEAAEEALKIMIEAHPEALIGAGTILSTEQAERAINAGAKFIVSPGFNPSVVDYCIERNITVIPGTVTPTEIEMALSKGLNTVKFFPAEAFGGLKMIKALSQPYNNVRFMPTGGINKENIADYLENDHIIACGGSYMVKKDLINAGDFEKIKELTKEAHDTVLKIRG